MSKVNLGVNMGNIYMTNFSSNILQILHESENTVSAKIPSIERMKRKANIAVPGRSQGLRGHSIDI